MEPIAASIVKRLDIAGACEREAEATRNLLPPEPWLPDLAEQASVMAKWIATWSARESPASESTIVAARKESGGVRPVPMVGAVERVLLRALTEQLIPEAERCERSAATYKSFVVEPAGHVFDAKSSKRKDSSNWYVLEADINSFYEYVDHGILRNELETRWGNLEIPRALTQLLSEIEGRAFGIPQLLEPSDWLSDIYIQKVERDVRRMGHNVWRFNDDFRFACDSYSAALGALEDLVAAARKVGLTINDHKTRILKYQTYFWQSFNIEVDEGLEAVDLVDVELAVGPYDPVGTSPDGTAATITEIGTGEGIDLRNATRNDRRRIQAALAMLAQTSDPLALDKIDELFRFAPSLTHAIGRYLTSLDTDSHRRRIKAIILGLIKRETASPWQQLWLLHVLDHHSILESSNKLSKWVDGVRISGKGTTVSAAASLALANVQQVDFAPLDMALRSEPTCLNPWYLKATQALAGSDCVTKGQIDALRRESRFNEVFLDVG